MTQCMSTNPNLVKKALSAPKSCFEYLEIVGLKRDGSLNASAGLRRVVEDHRRAEKKKARKS